MVSTLLADPAWQNGLRQALLQRIANDLAVAAALAEPDESAPLWPCCWVLHGEVWAHRVCTGCHHWHHQAEQWSAPS